jgi:nucleotide-binding universal stress UspA family protein
MLRTILIGLDGSASSNGALELATQWAQSHGARLTGLAIVDEPTIAAGAFETDHDDSLLRDAHVRADRVLEDFVRHCAARGVHGEILKEVGTPGERILACSKASDLIMVGNQANFHSATQDWDDDTTLLLFRQSSRPIVTVPEAFFDNPRVVIAYNGNPEADRALQAYVSLGLAETREIHVLAIAEDLASAASVARQAVDYLEKHDIKASLQTRKPLNSVGATIVQEVNDRDAGFVVMGACGRSWLREFIFGSTTSEVVASVQVPIFLSH